LGRREGIFRKGELWCILGLIKPTFDLPGFSIFLASSRLGGGAIAPLAHLPPWIRPCMFVWFVLLFCTFYFNDLATFRLLKAALQLQLDEVSAFWMPAGCVI